MRVIKRLNIILALSAMTIFTIGCKSDDPVTPSEQALAFALLAGNWTAPATGGILVDGQDVSVNYPGFTLSFTDGGFSTTNAADLFAATGTWTWTDEAAGAISLNDGKEITIVTLNQSTFNFTFQFAGTGGIANGVAGSYNVTVNK